VNYNVFWIPSAEQELALIWLGAADRAAVTRAAHALDRLIGEHGPRFGESRPEGWRVLHEAPLGITFTVDEGDRRVRVLHVWSFRRRPTH